MTSHSAIDGFVADEPSQNLLREILETNLVSDVTKKQQLVSAHENEDILSVTAKLSDHHISSLPIMDDDGMCIGVMDFSDAVAYLLKMDWSAKGWLRDGTNIWEDLANVPASTAIDLSKRNPKVEIEPTCSLLEAMSLFKEKKLRRALVVEKDSGDVVAVLSPSAVVRFIMQRLRGRNDVTMVSSVMELGLGSGSVTCIKKNQTVLEAMHLMHESYHSVVAVVDAKGGLVGSMSMSDIQTTFEEKKFSSLIMPCWNYIVEAREKLDMEVFPFFGVSPSDKLQMVVSKLLATSVHHLYVVDERNRPQHVISFSDVCALLFDKASE
mmetsp:Transcript_5344/g.10042  ORF Transcript_5344/g.10042 Transcript_5344/m.10042 type:complete len:324 (+) Transcript_5344:274-1245(+)|eukprot:CAMPEP_0184521724 /NCGR_PEP_ID=MMETSP0198_2-20121128/7858_1 /TAXON_ID=1112570 /ORGANISM="Thraustochytrium sp., Strain LLF1b" /LENGTH=323 /DNA_ID=CAMNT_0026912417 /DNA_START=171 /DNA_END=1142 /DNA_ORIENTATION=-